MRALTDVTTPSVVTTTAPTIGLGLVRPRPRSATKSARSMNTLSGIAHHVSVNNASTCVDVERREIVEIALAGSPT